MGMTVVFFAAMRTRLKRTQCRGDRIKKIATRNASVG
jgi:hypothetical protein